MHPGMPACGVDQQAKLLILDDPGLLTLERGKLTGDCGIDPQQLPPDRRVQRTADCVMYMLDRSWSESRLAVFLPQVAQSSIEAL